MNVTPLPLSADSGPYSLELVVDSVPNDVLFVRVQQECLAKEKNELRAEQKELKMVQNAKRLESKIAGMSNSLLKVKNQAAIDGIKKGIAKATQQLEQFVAENSDELERQQARMQQIELRLAEIKSELVNVVTVGKDLNGQSFEGRCRELLESMDLPTLLGVDRDLEVRSNIKASKAPSGFKGELDLVVGYEEDGLFIVVAVFECKANGNAVYEDLPKALKVMDEFDRCGFGCELAPGALLFYMLGEQFDEILCPKSLYAMAAGLAAKHLAVGENVVSSSVAAEMERLIAEKGMTHDKRVSFMINMMNEERILIVNTI
jgi:hypothetical protein